MFSTVLIGSSQVSNVVPTARGEVIDDGDPALSLEKRIDQV